MSARASQSISSVGGGAMGSFSNNVDVGNTGAKAFLEGLTAGAVGASFLFASPRAALDAGFMASYVRRNGTDVVLALGNMTVGALDPAATLVDVVSITPTFTGRFGDINAIRKGISGQPFASVNTFALDHGNIATLTTLEAAAAAIGASPRRYVPQVGDPLVCSPRAALPAGLALSHARVSAAGVITIGLANPTAGGIDPASLTWDVACIGRAGGGLPANTRIAREKRGGFFIYPVEFTINHGNIGAFDHLEATVDLTTVGLRGIAPGMPVAVAPTAALPAGIGLSYARISAANTVAVDLVNITAGAIDPAAQTYRIAIINDLAA